MNILIVKLGATGDVVRTTPLLRRLSGSVTWITAAKNGVFLGGLADNLRYFSWEARARALVRGWVRKSHDLWNIELKELRCRELLG